MDSARNHHGRIIVLAGAMFLLRTQPDVAASTRFDVVGSPTEVINTGRSEVLGSLNLVVAFR